uniref:Trafficking kinesin binding protein 1 n=1 Tax=Echinococcus granulosus TaxID=6210 RepID=A0A068WIQ4_ECHGR|nr:trafficking kinesin binding protein 1 [Echinococcus granulosus]
MSVQDTNNLSEEQIDCAFDYFLSTQSSSVENLSASPNHFSNDTLTNRLPAGGFHFLYDRKLQQMEGSLDDPQALRRLLTDKQNDLELAAQIGKSLLDRNRDLGRQLRESEQQMSAAMETINQLQHSLGMKEELLQMWNDQSANEADLPSADGPFGDPEVSRSRCRSETSGKNGTQASQDDIELIHRKLQALEEENASIRSTQKDEQQTVTLKECLRKLGDAMVYMKNLSDEQFRRSDALIQQQNQVNALAARSRELENSLNQVGLTNEMLASKVEELNTVNQNLVRELRDMKDKYDESLTLYTQAQATVRKLRDRSRRASLRPTRLLYSSIEGRQGTDPFSSPLTDKPLSIADELALSLREKSPQSGVALCPIDRRSCQAVDNTMEMHPNQAASRMRTGTECTDWDDPTIDSSGFASCSDPIDSAHRASGGRTEESSPAVVAALLDSRRLVLRHGLDWDVDELEQEPEVEEDEDESSEVIRAFTQHHTSLQLTPIDQAIQRPKLPDVRRPSPFSPSSREPSVNRRSWVVDQNAAALPPQHSFDDSTLGSTGLTSIFAQAVRPQRLQLVKQLQGSGVLQRWQRLATPSLTAALYEGPLSGVASRGGVPFSDSFTPTNVTSVSSFLSLRWASGADLSQMHPSSSPNRDIKFVPMSEPVSPWTEKRSSHTPFRNSDAPAFTASTDRLLSEFLAASKRARPIAMPAVRAGSTVAAAATRCTDAVSQTRSRRTSSPAHELTSFRAVSPVCRGLLDASEMTSEPLDLDVAAIKVPAPRPASPQTSTPPPSASLFRRPNISRASPTLHSVQEEVSSSHLGA